MDMGYMDIRVVSQFFIWIMLVLWLRLWQLEERIWVLMMVLICWIGVKLVMFRSIVSSMRMSIMINSINRNQRVWVWSWRVQESPHQIFCTMSLTSIVKKTKIICLFEISWQNLQLIQPLPRPQLFILLIPILILILNKKILITNHHQLQIKNIQIYHNHQILHTK